MKKLILSLIFVCCSISLYAQDSSPRVVSTQSVQAYPFGIGYVYELPIGWRTTLSGMVGIEHISQFGTFLAIWDGYTLYGDFEIRPAVQVQLKNYYNLRRRTIMQKNTHMNSGGYFSLIAHYGFHSIYSYGDMSSTLSIKPVWGFRHVKNNLFLEVWAGLQLFMVITSYSIDLCPGITAGIKFGYIF